MFEKSELDLAMLDIKLMAGITARMDSAAEERAAQPEEQPPQVFPSHDALCERVRKSLYYGRLPSSDRPSLPLTQLAVDRFAGVGLERLGRLDMRRAADLARDTCAGPTSLVLALIYLDRLRKSNPDYLSSVSSADLFLVSMMVASKYLHDDGEEDEVFNDEWAASGDMDIKEFNRMELGFLSALDWRIHVDHQEFETVMQEIEKDIALREVSSRGWQTSYTDLCVLTADLPLDHLLRLLTESALKLTSVCLTAYAASLLTLLGSAALLHQTPLGPAAVQNSLRVLTAAAGPSTAAEVAGKSSSGAVASETTSGADVKLLNVSSSGSSNGSAVMSPADLLTASILVATLTSSPADVDEPDDLVDLSFMETGTQETDYNTHAIRTNSDLKLNSGQLLVPGLGNNTSNEARAEWLAEYSQANLVSNSSSGWPAGDWTTVRQSPPSAGRLSKAHERDKSLLESWGLDPSRLEEEASLWSAAAESIRSRCPILRWGAQSRDWLQLQGQLTLLV